MIPLLIAGAAAAAGTFAGFHAYLPKSQLYGRTFIGTPGKGKKLALTFDDGPNPAATPKLLEVLARHNVRVTFFLIGKYVQAEPALARELVSAGHEVANHTQEHPLLILAGHDEVKRQLANCEEALAAAGVPNTSRLFRPPFGARRPRTLKTVRELGLAPVSWTVTCYDWKPTTAERVEAHALRQIRGGDVILLHDGGHRALNTDRMHTVRAVASMVPKLIDQGYEFVTIGDWLKA